MCAIIEQLTTDKNETKHFRMKQINKSKSLRTAFKRIYQTLARYQYYCQIPNNYHTSANYKP